MGLENVVSDILKSAQDEVSAITAERDSEVSKIIEEAKRRGERITGEMVASAEAEAGRISKQELSGANLEVRRMLLNMRKEILDETYRQALKRIRELDSTALLQSLIGAQSGDATRVYSSQQDRSTVEQLCTDRSIKYAGDIDCIGGILLETDDRTVRLDYTFDTIMDEVSERSMKRVSQILFEQT